MSIEYTPIGVVHSPFTELDGMPIQPSRGRGVAGTVEVFPQYAEGLRDLGGFSHVILVCHLHVSSGYRLRVVPFLDHVRRGLFATRAPRRPNPVGLSVVRLREVRDSELVIEDIDLLDGTPVIDIKPYVPEFDQRTEVRIGWLEAARKRGRSATSDRRFAPDVDGEVDLPTGSSAVDASDGRRT